MKLAIIDNYDSFTHNLHDLIYRVSGMRATIVRNDAMSFEDFSSLGMDCVVISPGPGHPGNRRDFGMSGDVLERFEGPVLGICLGHQGIASHCGGEVGRAPVPVHGLVEPINHDGADLFADLPQRVRMVRYHSLIVSGDLPAELKRTAWTDDGLTMGIRHVSRPVFGVQFHPESICSEYGDVLMSNFLRIVRHEI